MPNNDPLKSVENIVQLQSARRSPPVPALQVQPAQPTPPVLFASWVAARDRAAAALLGGAKRMVLTGPAGTGKTVLVEHAARVLRAAGRTVIIQLADADPAPPGPGVTLFVDEADRLSVTKLRQLLDEAAGSVVLTGLAPLVRRVGAGTVQLTLDPLEQTEARDYIAQWLALHGRTTAELDSKAVRVLVELSGGVPRLLSTLLAAGAWLAKSGGARVIEAIHIQEAAELRSVLGPVSAPDSAAVTQTPDRQRRVMWSALLASVALAGAAAAVVVHLFPSETDRAIARATPFVQQAERWFRPEPSAVPSRPVQVAAETPVPPAVPVPTEAAPLPAEPAPITEAAAPPEPPKSVPEPPKPEPAPPPVQAAPEPVQTAPVLPQPMLEPVQAAPEPPQNVPVPKPVSLPIVTPAATLPIETIELLLRRGRQMLALEDISAARLLFMRAAESDSAEAMFELGQTYDPAILTSLGAAKQSDRAEAIRWYRRAAAKGNRAAEQLIPKP